MNENFKDLVVNIATNDLPSVLFTSIYSSADTLFDLEAMKWGDIALSDQISFLKSTSVSEVIYKSTNQRDAFQLVNNRTNTSIDVSNRMPSGGELRGTRLRTLINDAKKTNPNQTLYEVINNAIKNPIENELVIYFKNGICSKMATEHMSSLHFDFFISFVLASIQDKISAGAINPHSDPIEIKKDDHLRNTIMQGIDISRLYDLTLVLNNMINELDEKSVQLYSRGYKDQARQLNRLVIDIKMAHRNFYMGNDNKETFVNNCHKMVLEAKYSDLSKLRGVSKVLFNILNTLTTIITLGVVNICTERFPLFQPKTDTINKLIAFDKVINDIDRATSMQN